MRNVTENQPPSQRPWRTGGRGAAAGRAQTRTTLESPGARGGGHGTPEEHRRNIDRTPTEPTAHQRAIDGTSNNLQTRPAPNPAAGGRGPNGTKKPPNPPQTKRKHFLRFQPQRNALHYKLGGKKSDQCPRTATKLLRKRYEGLGYGSRIERSATSFRLT